MILPVVATACTFILPHLVWFVKLDCCDVSHFLAVSVAIGFWGWGFFYATSHGPSKIFFFAFDTFYYTHSIMECQVLSLWYVPHFGTFLYLTHYRVLYIYQRFSLLMTLLYILYLILATSAVVFYTTV